MNQNNKYEKLFWSIALPGIGQILNRKLFKGFLFIGLEFLINVQSNFNKIIILSFHGNIEEAMYQTEYGWLMFYPCLYFFAIWDAFKDAGGGKEPYSFLPFVFSAYFVTVGTIYSPKLMLFGVLLGPIWLSMLSVLPGLFVGFLLKRILTKRLPP
ncbi:MULTISPECIES: hypothetical protein [Lentibacillus]|uniref:hypothetical protein n=1 Tax=Lentibacillus TaxID=175304 RepID=UPI00026263FE|nr:MULTISPECIES: hypothetical protein [Lentibacillus]QKY71326.1 hypothetical protein Len3610_18785 [Lentibacillus sp. CBA3610]